MAVGKDKGKALKSQAESDFQGTFLKKSTQELTNNNCKISKNIHTTESDITRLYVKLKESPPL